MFPDLHSTSINQLSRGALSHRPALNSDSLSIFEERVLLASRTQITLFAESVVVQPPYRN